MRGSGSQAVDLAYSDQATYGSSTHPLYSRMVSYPGAPRTPRHPTNGYRRGPEIYQPPHPNQIIPLPPEMYGNKRHKGGAEIPPQLAQTEQNYRITGTKHPLLYPQDIRPAIYGYPIRPNIPTSYPPQQEYIPKYRTEIRNPYPAELEQSEQTIYGSTGYGRSETSSYPSQTTDFASSEHATYGSNSYGRSEDSTYPSPSTEPSRTDEATYGSVAYRGTEYVDGYYLQEPRVVYVTGNDERRIKYAVTAKHGQDIASNITQSEYDSHSVYTGKLLLSLFQNKVPLFRKQHFIRNISYIIKYYFTLNKFIKYETSKLIIKCLSSTGNYFVTTNYIF